MSNLFNQNALSNSDDSLGLTTRKIEKIKLLQQRNKEIQEKYAHELKKIPEKTRKIIQYANTLSENSDRPITVFRLDSRPPDVIFKIGFSSLGSKLPPGESIPDRIKNYQGNNLFDPAPVFISTAKSRKTCYNNPFAKGYGACKKFLYEICLVKNQYVDPNKITNQSLDDEILCFGRIFPEQVGAAEEVDFIPRVFQGRVLKQTHPIVTGRKMVNVMKSMLAANEGFYGIFSRGCGGC